MAKEWFSSVKVPSENFLRKKETFEYTTAENIYDIDVFTNQDGTHYAIGVPREGRVIVYGSAVVDDYPLALQMVIDKIRREGMEKSHKNEPDER